MRLGYWLPPKKLHKQRMSGCLEHFARNGFDVIAIDLERPLEAQGPFDVVIQKVTDLMSLSATDPLASRQVAALEAYLKAHPACTLIDDLDAVRVCTDRVNVRRAIESARGSRGADAFRLAPAVVIASSSDADRIDEQTISFPVCTRCIPFGAILIDRFFLFTVAKPASACGLAGSHKMYFVRSPAQLRHVASLLAPPSNSYSSSSSSSPSPFLLGEALIRHTPAVVWKAYILGNHVTIVGRTSLSEQSVREEGCRKRPRQGGEEEAEPEQEPEQEGPVLLDTSNISKEPSRDTTLEDATRARLVEAGLQVAQALVLCFLLYDLSIDRGGDNQGLGLLGVDFVIEDGTRDIYAVDVNYFPGAPFECFCRFLV